MQSWFEHSIQSSITTQPHKHLNVYQIYPFLIQKWAVINLLPDHKIWKKSCKKKSKASKEKKKHKAIFFYMQHATLYKITHKIQNTTKIYIMYSTVYTIILHSKYYLHTSCTVYINCTIIYFFLFLLIFLFYKNHFQNIKYYFSSFYLSCLHMINFEIY